MPGELQAPQALRKRPTQHRQVCSRWGVVAGEWFGGVGILGWGGQNAEGSGLGWGQGQWRPLPQSLNFVWGSGGQASPTTSAWVKCFHAHFKPVALAQRMENQKPAPVSCHSWNSVISLPQDFPFSHPLLLAYPPRFFNPYSPWETHLFWLLLLSPLLCLSCFPLSLALSRFLPSA